MHDRPIDSIRIPTTGKPVEYKHMDQQQKFWKACAKTCLICMGNDLEKLTLRFDIEVFVEEVLYSSFWTEKSKIDQIDVILGVESSTKSKENGYLLIDYENPCRGRLYLPDHTGGSNILYKPIPKLRILVSLCQMLTTLPLIYDLDRHAHYKQACFNTEYVDILCTAVNEFCGPSIRRTLMMYLKQEGFDFGGDDVDYEALKLEVASWIEDLK